MKPVAKWPILSPHLADLILNPDPGIATQRCLTLFWIWMGLNRGNRLLKRLTAMHNPSKTHLLDAIFSQSKLAQAKTERKTWSYYVVMSHLESGCLYFSKSTVFISYQAALGCHTCVPHPMTTLSCRGTGETGEGSLR